MIIIHNIIPRRVDIIGTYGNGFYIINNEWRVYNIIHNITSNTTSVWQAEKRYSREGPTRQARRNYSSLRFFEIIWRARLMRVVPM